MMRFKSGVLDISPLRVYLDHVQKAVNGMTKLCTPMGAVDVNCTPMGYVVVLRAGCLPSLIWCLCSVFKSNKPVPHTNTNEQ